jgi:hypothetical protein
MLRPTLEERRKVAQVVHAWRTSFAAHRLLSQPPPHFAFFQQQLGLKPLLVTPQGYVVLLIKVRTNGIGSACNLCRMLILLVVMCTTGFKHFIT